MQLFQTFSCYPPFQDAMILLRINVQRLDVIRAAYPCRIVIVSRRMRR